MRRNAAISTCAIFLSLAGCGDDPALDRTIATVEGVRGEAHIGDTALERIGRAAAEQEISVGERSLARSMDSARSLSTRRRRSDRRGDARLTAGVRGGGLPKSLRRERARIFRERRRGLGEHQCATRLVRRAAR
jgi:hypothetical protein